MSFGFDLLFLLGGWAAAQVVFHGYEAHVPPGKRLVKLLAMTAMLMTVRTLFGRRAFYTLLALMTVGMAVLHGYWFHHRHGVHWRTAEPRDKYLRLLGKD